jgi:prophage regulatory protein
VSDKGKGPSRVLRCAEVMNRTGLSKATIYRLMDRGLFPLRRRLCSGAVGWSEEEIEAWIDERFSDS